MLHMAKHYDPELRETSIRLYPEEVQTMVCLSEEYNISQDSLRYC